MTVEEIKQTVSMRDVLDRYHIPVNRKNKCLCPFHNDSHPSMQIYPDSYYCFVCQESGDIFTFIQKQEGCSFKDAFLMLGGTYENSDNKTRKRLLRQKFERKRQKEQREKEFEREFRKMLDDAIYKCKVIIAYHEPFGDGWCKAQNALPWLEYVWDLKYIEDEEINKADVIRVCKRIERIRHTFG